MEAEIRKLKTFTLAVLICGTFSLFYVFIVYTPSVFFVIGVVMLYLFTSIRYKNSITNLIVSSLEQKEATYFKNEKKLKELDTNHIEHYRQTQLLGTYRSIYQCGEQFIKKSKQYICSFHRVQSFTRQIYNSLPNLSYYNFLVDDCLLFTITFPDTTNHISNSKEKQLIFHSGIQPSIIDAMNTAITKIPWYYIVVPIPLLIVGIMIIGSIYFEEVLIYIILGILFLMVAVLYVFVFQTKTLVKKVMTVPGRDIASGSGLDNISIGYHHFQELYEKYSKNIMCTIINNTIYIKYDLLEQKITLGSSVKEILSYYNKRIQIINDIDNLSKLVSHDLLNT